VTYKKGQSGNPRGRPKKGHAMADALRVALGKRCDDGKIKRRALAEKVVEMALDGNTEAIKLVFERMDGKVAQTNVLQGSEEAPPIRYVQVGD